MKILYGKSKSGKIKEWRASVEGNTITIEYGYVDGKMQTTTVVATPKNEGKSNATTAEEQAVREYEALIKAQMDKEHYKESIEELEACTVVKPMLAQTYDIAKIKFPCYVQPKLNGVRCLVARIDENTFTFTSRKNTLYTTLDFMSDELKQIMKVGDIFDGEIYIHGMEFQDILSLVKREQEDSKKLQYWIYDVVNPVEYIKRAVLLKRLFEKKNFKHLVRVQTYKAINEKEIMQIHKTVTKGGNEGSIIRNGEGIYEGFRSKNLLKYKDFLDAEFEIVGAEQGTGLHEGCIVFVCKGKKGKKEFTFNATPKFSLEKRRKMFEKNEKYIGKLLTVKYQNLSKDGVPIFPVGLAVRDYE